MIDVINNAMPEEGFEELYYDLKCLEELQKKLEAVLKRRKDETYLGII